MQIKKSGSTTVQILSFLFAGILWFNVTTDATFQHKITLPIKYVGPSEGFIISTEKPGKTEVIVSGTGKALFRFSMAGFVDTENRYALVNLAGLPAGENKVTIEKPALHLGDITGLTIERILFPNNATFAIGVDRNIKRTVAVNADSIVGYNIAEGYVLTRKPTVRPQFVMIEGPESFVSALDAVAVTSLKGTMVSAKDTLAAATLAVPPFITVEPADIEVLFPVEQILSRELKGIPITLTGFPRNRRPTFAPDSLMVAVRGPRSSISNLDSSKISLTVTYESFREQISRGDSTIVPVISVPDGISVTGVTPSFVRVAGRS